MAKAETSSNRLPRGTKPVAQAFFAALESIPEASRSAVARAAQALIRDELKTRRERQKSMRADSKIVAPTRKTRTKQARGASGKPAVNSGPLRRGRHASAAGAVIL